MNFVSFKRIGESVVWRIKTNKHKYFNFEFNGFVFEFVTIGFCFNILLDGFLDGQGFQGFKIKFSSNTKRCFFLNLWIF